MLAEDHIDPPLALIFIGTLLRQAGHDVSVVDLTDSNASIPEAEVYGISFFTGNYNQAKRVMSELKPAVVVAGGRHASVLPKDVLDAGFDAVVVGECEANVVSLMEAVNAGKRGILEGEAAEDLDSLPSWDYSLVNMDSYTRTVRGEPGFTCMTSRGCPYRCFFCQAGSRRSDMRYHSIERVMDEISSRRGRINFCDNNFGADHERLLELCGRLKPLGRKYQCSMRVADLTDETCKALHGSGCISVSLGVENGSDDILRKMNKQQSTQDIQKGLEAAEKAGLFTRISLIVGFPGETWKTVRDGVDFLKTVPFDQYATRIFVPFPGSLPFKKPEKFGITWLSHNWAEYHTVSGDYEPHACFETADLTRQDMYGMWSYVVDGLSDVAELR
jgi:radical SAM superfamily enzyme YgiQ (UPF0313 family)